MKTIKITKKLAQKVLQVVDVGLCSGLGSPKPGQMCVEAAVNYACGLPHGDNPPCVGGAVRAFKIALNDGAWSNNSARAEGMRKIAVAQLGSNTLDQLDFSSRLAVKNVQVLLPQLFLKLKLDEAVAKQCESASNLESAKSAKSAAWSAAWSAESAAKSAKSAAWSAAWSAWSAAKSAESAKSAAWSAAWSAESAESAKSAESDPDYFLKLSADICLQVLIDMKAPGTKYLYLTE